MRLINLQEEQESLAFAREAAKAFEENPKYSTYSTGVIKEGEYFAVRWGMNDRCVLIFKVSHDFTPTVYTDLIPKEVKE